MFNNQFIPSLNQLVTSLNATIHALNTIKDPELEIALLGVIQSLVEGLYDLCDERIEALFDQIPVTKNDNTPPLACQVDD